MPYIPHTLNPGPDEGDPVDRMSMLPFGTYPDPTGGGYHLGFAVPGMITEPVNALMRLIGTPSNPGTFTQGPDYGSNADDMRTLLETFTGGNATRGAGAVESAATHAIPEAMRAGAGEGALAQVASHELSPYAGFLSHELAPGEFMHFRDPENPGQFASRFNTGAGPYTAGGEIGPDGAARVAWIGPDKIGDLNNAAGSLGRQGLKQWRDSFLHEFPEVTSFSGQRVSGAKASGVDNAIQTIPALFSDTTPSPLGAMVAGAEHPIGNMPENLMEHVPPRSDLFPAQGVARMSDLYAGMYPDFLDGNWKHGDGAPVGGPNDMQSAPLSTYDTAALDQLWRNKIKQTGELYSDTSHPSPLGAMVAGAEKNVFPDSWRNTDLYRMYVENGFEPFQSTFSHNGSDYLAKGSISPNGAANVHWIGNPDEHSADLANTLNRSALRAWRDQFLTEHPNVKEFNGVRISGAHADTETPGQSIPALFSGTGLPSLWGSAAAPNSNNNSPKGQVTPGNIDLGSRPVVSNPDGTYSTVRSITVDDHGRSILLPTVSDDGRVMSNREAIQHYLATGRHLGIFNSSGDADAYGEQLHEDQARRYTPQMALPTTVVPTHPDVGMPYAPPSSSLWGSALQPQEQQYPNSLFNF